MLNRVAPAALKPTAAKTSGAEISALGGENPAGETRMSVPCAGLTGPADFIFNFIHHIKVVA